MPDTSAPTTPAAVPFLTPGTLRASVLLAVFVGLALVLGLTAAAPGAILANLRPLAMRLCPAGTQAELSHRPAHGSAQPPAARFSLVCLGPHGVVREAQPGALLLLIFAIYFFPSLAAALLGQWVLRRWLVRPARGSRPASQAG